MDVRESDWVSKAIDNVDMYLHRGGRCQGDVPQLLGGTNLLNTIGMAMGLPMRDPADWSDSELHLALEGELVFFEGIAREAIDVIASQIRSCCDGDDKNFVSVLPVELYFDGKLYELPVFRVQRYKSSRKYFVDNIGCSYNSFDDWFENNELPPCEMAYPYDLELMLRPGHDYSRVLVDNTPSARSKNKPGRAEDTGWSFAGIVSGLERVILSSGLPTPVSFAAGSVSGTAISGALLYDRRQRGESINPFTDAESRRLWLGVAANLVGFSAMGASMRLSLLAARGQNISNAFRLFVNVANGTNVGVSGLAILDSTINLCNHQEELTGIDILMHAATVGFWTKGLFKYKTAGGIIRDSQNLAIKYINQELTQDQASKLTDLREQFKNVANLLREFHRAAESSISISQFSQIILDANACGTIQFDGSGNIILPGGIKYSFQFLNGLSQSVRQRCFEIVTHLTPEQTETFESFRRVINDDMNVITGLIKVAVDCKISAREATEGIINFWNRFSRICPRSEMDVKLTDDNLVLGSAPPIQIQQLPQFSTGMMCFFGDHLSRLDVITTRRWAYSVPVLLSLQTNGMFTVCPVTSIITSGNAVVSLNNHLHISIYRLHEITADNCGKILELISILPSTISSRDLGTEVVRLCCRRHRLRLQCQRADSLNWMKNNFRNHMVLKRLIDSNLEGHELDRLYTFKSTVDTFKASPYMNEMMNFVSDRNPNNVDELVAYCEYVVKYVETEKLMVEKKLKDGILTLPRNVTKAEFTRETARVTVFRDQSVLLQKFLELIEIVTNQEMIGIEEVSKNLSNTELVAVLRRTYVRFGSVVLAAYHIFKHPTEPLQAYVERANATLRSAEHHSVELVQEGDARTLRFQASTGSCVVLERDGRVQLCTFTPTTSSPRTPQT